MTKKAIKPKPKAKPNARAKSLAQAVLAPPRDPLATFEALVQTQQAADKPWQPVTDYSADARRLADEPQVPLIVQAFAPTRILDAGCGAGHLVRLLCEAGLDAVGCDVTRSPAWLDAPRFGAADVANPNSVQPFTGAFDLVICREVLEHLTIRQIRQAVTNLCHWTTHYVYLTTRFHPAPTHLLDVATSDDLDPTHISMLNQDFLRTLFVLEGLTRRADLELIMDWKTLGRVLVYAR
jgi:SAM-dependent methyltransferase